MTATAERTPPRPVDPADAPTERLDLIDLTSPEVVKATIENHQVLLGMKDQARSIFEVNDNTPTGQAEKVRLIEAFAEDLENFQTSKKGEKFSRAKRFFPTTEQRDAIAEQLIQIAENPQAYIDDTPALENLLREAKKIVVIFAGPDPEKRALKADRLRALKERLDNFYDTSPIGAKNKQEIVDIIMDAATRVKPEDLIAAHRRDDDDDDPTRLHDIPILSPEAEAKRLKNRRLHLEAMAVIDATDRLRGYERVMALGDLAINKLKGQDYGYGDLGVIAAKRIHRSQVRGPLGQIMTRRVKQGDLVLHKLATDGKGNVTAAKAMVRGGYRRNKSYAKGRNDALYEISLKQDVTTDDGLETANELLLNMRGRRSSYYHYEGKTSIAERRADPAQLTAVKGLYDFYRKQQAKAKTAVAIAKTGDIFRGERLAASLPFWSVIRNKTLAEINNLQLNKTLAEAANP